jgi:hypothetical protein
MARDEVRAHTILQRIAFLPSEALILFFTAHLAR